MASNNLASGLAKRARGEEPTYVENRALVKHDREQRERIITEFAESCPRAAFKRLSGRKQHELEAFQRNHGITLGGDVVNLNTVVAALMDAVEDRLNIDDIESGADSPNLERLRGAKADIAEIERDKRRGELLPRDEMRAGLLGIAGCIRDMGERLEREFGHDARQLLDDALDEARAGIDRLFPESGLAAVQTGEPEK
jgi:hypothetical protein